MFAERLCTRHMSYCSRHLRFHVFIAGEKDKVSPWSVGAGCARREASCMYKPTRSLQPTTHQTTTHPIKLMYHVRASGGPVLGVDAPGGHASWLCDTSKLLLIFYVVPQRTWYPFQPPPARHHLCEQALLTQDCFPANTAYACWKLTHDPVVSNRDR